MDNTATTASRWQHPEIKLGEVFVGNFSREGFAREKFETGRLGEIAYDAYGERRHQPAGKTNFFPAFISILEAAQKDIRLPE